MSQENCLYIRDIWEIILEYLLDQQKNEVKALVYCLSLGLTIRLPIIRYYSNVYISSLTLPKEKRIIAYRTAHKIGIAFDPITTWAAACSDSLECLRFANENGCTWDSDTVNAAAWVGSKRCLEYIRGEYGFRNWSFRMINYATSSGNKECIEYVKKASGMS